MSDDTRPLSGAPALLAGRYRLRGSIGQGGMAEVQRAHDEQLDREVAVKILHARYSDDESFLLRFQREARSAASLNHPNIVSVYDAGETEGRPFIVMELVRGRSLRELTRSERITAGRATEIVGDAALALNYAHEHGLIHRDIKPGNIMISQDGEVKVTDFGIARAVNAETITETAAVFGTAAYVSPEQAQGDTVDRRTDVYSLGCVLYELLAGRQPFSADSPVALAYQHVSAIPDPPSEFSDEATAELDAITLKSMAKDPDDRYQTARDFNADLERERAGVPVTAPMAGAWAATQAADGWDAQTVASTPGGSTRTYPTDDRHDEEEYYYEEEPRRRTGWVVATILLLLALLAGGWWLMTMLTGEETQTEVLPDVTGEQEDVAIERLNALGFTDISVERAPQSDVAQGQVFEQDPQASDEAIPLDTPIALTVSSGPEQVEVPDVAGTPQQEASQTLREANLQVGNSTREYSDLPQGQVIRTDPPAGDEVDEGTQVDLIISRGSSTATVPDVSGLTEDEARLRIEGACEPQPCFEVSTVEQSSADIGEGRVISQSPGGGTEQPKQATVTLVVSTGPEQQEEPEPSQPAATVEVPDVVGLAAEDAATALEQAGLQVGDVTEESSDSAAGVVISSTPGAGEQVPEQEPIALVVSTGPEASGDGDADAPGNSGSNGNDNTDENADENADDSAALQDLVSLRRP